ncbi:MAG: protein kinase [Myxococcales bacterium]
MGRYDPIVSVSHTARQPAPTGSGAPPLPKLVGRYQLRSELGRGGMATVYRAFDEGKQREVALKVLERSEERLISLFEREFETLAYLAHPRVIAAYDFGIAEGRRFYTMELLTGQDLLALSPLPWLRVCEIARDVCTSLVLLHAQRLVHRDVNPLNVRIDGEGRAKLIDFGALCDFGRATEAVGTPNCVAPEVLRGRELDQRTDLFSLGSVMYYALTGTTPYAVPRFSEAEAAWRRPPEEPSQRVQAIPKALDELVLSLLSLDPMGRPGHAAELIDRLSALAQLDDEPLAGLAGNHLFSSLLVGREREQSELGRLGSLARTGQGEVVVVAGNSGIGKTRLVASACVDAQLSGVTTLRVEARSCAGGDELLRALIASAFEAAPAEATRALPDHLEQLRELLPAPPDMALKQRMAPANDVTPRGRENERASLVRRQLATARWLGAIARNTPLLLAIDDAHLLPPDAAGVLTMLAERAYERPLVLLVAHCGEVPTAPAVAQLPFMGTQVNVLPFDELAVDKLVRSIFGDVPQRTRLSEWLVRSAQGNPGKVVSLLSRLLASKAIRYAGGAWVLPHELRDTDLDEVEVAPERLNSLSANARRLAQLLGLEAGATSEVFLSRVCAHLEASELSDALTELVRAQAVIAEQGTYRLASARVRELVDAALGLDERRALHRAMAEALRGSQASEHAAILAGRPHELSALALLHAIRCGLHSLRAGEEALATQVLCICATELAKRGDALMTAVPDLEGAIHTYRALGRSRNVYAPLTSVLVLAGTYSDFRLNYRYGEELLDTFAEAAGLKWAARLERHVPGRVALYLSLAVAFVLSMLAPRRRIGTGFRDVMLGLIGVGSAVLGICPVTQDRLRAERVREQLRMLWYFPQGHPAHQVHGFQLALVDHAAGRFRESAERCRKTLAYLSSPAARKALREDARAQLESGIYTLLAQLDALRTDDTLRETLEATTRLRAFTAPQTRAAARVTYHGHRGERAQFLKALEELDQLAAASGATWRNDVQVPRMMWSTYAMCEDVLSLKRAVQQLDRLAEVLPSVAEMRDAVNACYLTERGLYDEALAHYAGLFEAPREGLRRTQYRAAHARLLRKAGRASHARKLCEEELALLVPGDYDYAVLVFAVERELVLALTAEGNLDRARQLADKLVADQSGHDNGLLIGLAHGARAEVALAESDTLAFEHHLEQMRKAVRPLDNPALFACAQRLQDRARGNRAKGSVRPAARDEATQVLALSTSDRLDPAQRARQALEAAVQAAGADGGYLFVTEAGSLVMRERTLDGPTADCIEELTTSALFEDGSFSTDLTSAGGAAVTPAEAAEGATGAPLSQPWSGRQAYWFSLPISHASQHQQPGTLVLVARDKQLARVPFSILTRLASAV